MYFELRLLDGKLLFLCQYVSHINDIVDLLTSTNVTCVVVSLCVSSGRRSCGFEENGAPSWKLASSQSSTPEEVLWV